MKSNKRKYVEEEDVRSRPPASKWQRLWHSFKSKNSQCRVKEADPLEKEDTSRSMSSDANAPNMDYGGYKSNKRKYVEEEDVRSPPPASKRRNTRGFVSCQLASPPFLDFRGTTNDNFITHRFDMKSNKRKYVEEEDVRSISTSGILSSPKIHSVESRKQIRWRKNTY
jgi:hypothetical protein